MSHGEMVLDTRLSEEMGGAGDPFRCGGLAGTVGWDNGAQWRQTGNLKTCTMCGGLHLADLVRLVREGAVLEPTTKKHKLYVSDHPDLASITGASKYYYWHCHDKETVAEYNELVKQLQPKPGGFHYRLPDSCLAIDSGMSSPVARK